MDSFLCVVSEQVLFEMTYCYVYVQVIDLCQQALIVFRYPTYIVFPRGHDARSYTYHVRYSVA
jgi:hypothetical protein